MAKRVPSKLPQVEGDGPVAEGFRLAFGKLNEIIEYLDSIAPAPSADSYTEQTVVGVTRRPKAKGGETGEEDEGEARWA